MSSLVSIFNQAGCTSVQTYIQSGNVIFEAEAALAGRIPAIIKGSISEQLGLEISVVTRTTIELRKIIRSNPFLRSGADERALHVAFLADAPSAAKIAALDPDRSLPDEFVMHGREIYLQCPNGLARSKLTNAYFDTALATTSTLRNWRTTLKLLQLAEG
jgi:uncharacterized protein (DUF1697 family)